MIILKRRSLGGVLLGTTVCALVGLRGGAAQEPRTHRVDIRAFAFEPDELTIAVGDTVEWINHDLASHTATEMDGAWDTGELAKGDVQSVRFDRPAQLDYFCAFHPHMRGRVTIAAPRRCS
ncbi:MAG: cupredoxin family copper-binding protein [Pseudomonadota bacterium]